MKAPLVEDKVCAFLVDHPGSTLTEIARGIRAQDTKVRETLQNPLFQTRTDGKRTVYLLASVAGDGQGRANNPSQAAKMRRLLDDGCWHSIGELWEVGVGRPNSRAAELRPRLATHGLTVEHRIDRDESSASRAHQYRIRPLDRAGACHASSDVRASAPALSSGPVPTALPPGPDGTLSPSPGPLAIEPDGQLVLAVPETRRQAAA